MSDTMEIIISAVDQASDVFSSIVDSVTGMGTDISVAFEEASNEVERLTQELADIEMGNVEGDFDAVASELAAAQEEAARLKEEMYNVDDAAKQTGDDLGLINSAMLMSLGEQVGNLGNQAEGMAQGMNTAAISVGQLATNVGMAEPEMISLINTISNATFPQNEAIAYTNALNQMGVEAGKLGDAATNMDRINDATGLGYDNVIKLTQGLQSMGITADNLPSSFNAIAYAQANVTGGTETLQRTLMRQASTINEYGLNVDQVVLIMQKLSETGVSTTKMGTELSKVLKENNGDITAIESSLGMANGTLSNASSITGEYEGQLQSLADEEMQHKTILDQIGAAWEDVSLSLGSTMSPLMGVVGAFGQLGSFGLQVKGLKELVTTFSTMRTALMELNIIQAITSSEFYAMATAELAAAWPILAVVAAIALITAAVYELGIQLGWWDDFGGMIDAFYNNILMPVYDFLVSLFAPAWNAIGAAINAVIPYISNLANAFTMFMSGQISLPDLLWAVMTSMYNVYSTIFSMIISALASFGANMLQQGVSGATNFVNGIINRINQVPGRVRSILVSVISVIVSVINQWASNAKNKAQAIVDGVRNTLSKTVGAVRSALNGVKDAIVKPFQDGYNEAKKWYDKITSLDLGSIGMGGDELVGGNGFNAGVDLSQTGGAMGGELTLVHDFKNLPNGVSAGEVADIVLATAQSKEFGQAIASNSGFQSTDLKIKNTFAGRINRANGV